MVRHDDTAFIFEMNGDGITLDRIDIDTVT